MQEPYIRTRENPYFDGLVKTSGQVPLNSQGGTNSSNILVSVSDSGETTPKKFVSDEVIDHLPLENLAVSDFNYESSQHSSSERWLEASKISPFIQLDIQSKLIDQHANTKHVLGNGCSLIRTPEADHEEHRALQSHAITNMEKTYTITRRKEKLSSVLLPLSAASYYNGISPEMDIVESCESIAKLNAYLKARKDDVNAGVPGKFLHAVIGSDDAGIISSHSASRIYYSKAFIPYINWLILVYGVDKCNSTIFY